MTDEELLLHWMYIPNQELKEAIETSPQDQRRYKANGIPFMSLADVWRTRERVAKFRGVEVIKPKWAEDELDS